MSGANDNVEGDQLGHSHERKMVAVSHRLWERLRHRYEGSAAQDFAKGLGDVEIGNWIILFGASFLLSVLPLILLLSAFANSRVDDNIDTRLGLSQKKEPDPLSRTPDLRR